MLQENTFVRNDVMPSWWANAIQRMSSLAFSNVVLRLVNNTTIEVPAAADQGAAILSVGGKWRWNEAAAQRAHPGGNPGTYPVFAASKAQSISTDGTDSTDRSWSIVVTAPGTEPTPTTGGNVLFRRIGRVVWDGAKITALVQELGTIAGAMLADDAIRAVTGDLVVARQADGGFLLSLAPERSEALPPIGVMLPFAGTAAPNAAWAIATGQAVSRVTYAALYAILGGAASPWGNGDGSSTFNLPDPRGRAVIGAGTGGGLTARAVAARPGLESVTLGASQIPAHTHPAAQDAHIHGPNWADSAFLALSGGGPPLIAQGLPLRGPGAESGLTATNTNSAQPNVYVGNNTGGGGSHENMQPSLAMNYLIRLR